MIRKVSGRNKKSECIHTKSSDDKSYSTKEISNALGENFQKKILPVRITVSNFKMSKLKKKQVF